jgi:hypothetical protein
MARSIALASCTPITLNSIPIGPTAWIAANWPCPTATVGSLRTAARVDEAGADRVDH